ncbi:MAG: FxLYD domain-containing protein, partial [Nitrososphaerales archaeon]
MGGKTESLAIIVMLSLSVFTYVDVLADGQVRVVGHKMSVDTAGVVHISGIVENNSNNAVGFVHVTAYLFDENGNKLPTYDTSTLLRTIPSGYMAPFDIPISDQMVGKNVSSYTLSLEWKTVQPKADKFAFSDLRAFVWTHIDPRTKELRNPHGPDTGAHHDSYAHSEISAFVSNTGDLTTRTVKVVAVWYDERGQYYSYDMQTIARQMATGENSRFVIMTHPTMGYYSLIAESEDYVSMLADNGGHMFRVHEANSDNRILPGVDTMSIKNIVVKDDNDNIVSKIPVKTKSVLPHFVQTSGESNPIINYNGKEYQLQVLTYANQLIDLNYDQKTKTITMSTNGIDGKDPIHIEMIIPNTFNEFLIAESFKATLNGVLLHDRLFFVDPYSYEGKTAMHFIISADDLKALSKQVTEQYSTSLVFTLQPSTSSKTISVKVGEPIQLKSTVTNNIDKRQK